MHVAWSLRGGHGLQGVNTMSRLGTGDVIERKAGSNVYTILVIAATLASLLAMIVLYARAQTIFSGGLL
jgi:hypothetical protein